MTENNQPIDVRNISTSVLISGLPYQRPVLEKDVATLARNWNPQLCDPLVVSHRDGKFYLVDGQHRASVIRQMNNGADVMVPCKVYTGLTYEQEAELCVKLDEAKNRLSMAQNVIARLESGADAEMLDIKRRIESNGFTWALGRRFPGDYEIIAARATIRAYRKLGGAAFDRMLRLMALAWHGAPCSLRASFISGMALFLKTYETELPDDIAVKRLSTIDPEEVLRRGKTDFSTNHSALRYARILRKKYNSQHGGHKLPYRFKE